MRINRTLAIAAFAGTAALAGCHKQPGGQVVATVNGEEVTLQELNTELQATNISASTDKQAVQKALLQRVIDRKLVDGLAKDRDLDKSSDYLAQTRRLNEILLAQLYAKQQLAAVPVPSGADIAKFMTDNPGIFANRQQLVLDQLRFQQPSNPGQLSGVEGIHTLDGVAAFLKAKGIQFSRQPAQIDSAALPAPLLTQINNLPAGEPFVIPTGGVLTVNVITQRKAVANDPAQAKSVAAAAWREQKVQQAVNDQLTAARNTAKISYQPGFEPPAKKSAPKP
jgi:EpsD family peptidyl-prolyl cis-trans isomerase